MVAEFMPQFSASANLPPQNVDAEESILGAILLDPQAISRVADRLRPEVFYISAHQLIYKAALAIHSLNQVVDLTTVATWLCDHKLLEKVGGQCRLAELVDRTVSSANIDRYAELIIDKFIRRQLIQVGNRTIQAAFETFRKLPDVFSEARERLGALLGSVKSLDEDPDELFYNKICLEVRQIELNITDPGLKLVKLQKLAENYKKSTKQLEAIYFMSLLKEENEGLMTWKELCDKYGESVREWILHGFLPKGVAITIHARGGIGKTRLAYDMLYSLLQGESWNGFPSTGKRRAILIQTDESAGDMLDALRRRGFDADMDNIRYKTRWTFEHIPQLRAEMEEFKPEVIVIDSITSVNRHSLFSENDVEYARPILKLKDLAQQYGCTIILIHHSSKTGDARGTTAIFNSVSEVWKLERNPENKASDSTGRLLTIEKSRSRRPATYQLDFNPEEGSWKVLGEVGVSENNPDLTAKEKIVEFLSNHANVRYEAIEIAQEINSSPNHIRNCCIQLAADGTISHVRPITKGRGKATLYFLQMDEGGGSALFSSHSVRVSGESAPPSEKNMPFLQDNHLNHLSEGGGSALFSSHSVRVSAESAPPSEKNMLQEQTEIRKKSAPPCTLASNPCGCQEKKVHPISAPISAPPSEMHLSNPSDLVEAALTKHGIKIISKEEYEEGRSTLPENLKPGQWAKILNPVTNRKEVVQIVRGPNQYGLYSYQQADDRRLVGSLQQDQFEVLSKEEICQMGLVNRPPSTPPYHAKTNPPKKGDRIRDRRGRKGQIIEVKATNPRYGTQWQDGREKFLDLKDLQDLDIRKED